MTLIAYVLPKLETAKNVVFKCLKSPVSEQPSRVNMLKFTKHCWSLKERPFIRFEKWVEKKWVEKCVSY